MEFAKDKVYTIKYLEDCDRKRGTFEFIKLILGIGIVFSCINVILIVNFFKLLGNL